MAHFLTGEDLSMDDFYPFGDGSAFIAELDAARAGDDNAIWRLLEPYREPLFYYMHRRFPWMQ